MLLLKSDLLYFPGSWNFLVKIPAAKLITVNSLQWSGIHVTVIHWKMKIRRRNLIIVRVNCFQTHHYAIVYTGYIKIGQL